MLHEPEDNFPARQNPMRESTQKRQRRKINALDERCFVYERELTRQAGIIRRLREENNKQESLFEIERDYMKSKVEEVRQEYERFTLEEESRRCWEEGKMRGEIERLKEELEESKRERRKLGLEVFKLVAERRCRGVE